MKYFGTCIALVFTLTCMQPLKALSHFYQRGDTVHKIALTILRADKLLANASQQDPWEKMPDASSIAWLETANLNMLADLYEATGDSKYLVELARRGDRVLGHRDDKRGVKDGSGLSRPAWSMGSKYVVANGVLKDEDGKTLITIVSTPSSNNQLTRVEIAPFDRKNKNRFTIKVSNSHHNRHEVFEDLSLDPADARYAEKIINDPMAPYGAKSGHYTDKSNLIAVTVKGNTLPAKQTIMIQPITLAYIGYIGIIYYPMLRFAELVKADPALKHLQPAASRFIQAAEESYADAGKRLWREGPNKGEGHYLTCERGESFPADNVPAPINYLGKHVASELILHRLTGKEIYLERSKKMCLLLKNRLNYNAAANLYTWNYWYEPMTTKGWVPEDQLSHNVKYFKAAPYVEDASHGALDIGMVAAAYREGIVFNKEDMLRFSNTLLKNVITKDRKTVRRRVDGGDEHPGYFMALRGWLELAAANQEVYHAIRQTYLNNGVENLAFTAELLKWERRLL
ncbi:hypothetical protein [Pedobacter heparinus]|uniref:hypothetical protein n=1 Tax=Pedobacter heparinus TaxID=984 RepID=UPI002930EAFF|nr:hypothetical protein [Pedobacter heparinus]